MAMGIPTSRPGGEAHRRPPRHGGPGGRHLGTGHGRDGDPRHGGPLRATAGPRPLGPARRAGLVRRRARWSGGDSNRDRSDRARLGTGDQPRIGRVSGDPGRCHRDAARMGAPRRDRAAGVAPRRHRVDPNSPPRVRRRGPCRGRRVDPADVRRGPGREHDRRPAGARLPARLAGDLVGPATTCRRGSV